MSLGRILKKIRFMLLVLIVGVILCATAYISIFPIAQRERILSETPASSVVENPDSGLKSKIVLRYYYTGGLDGVETYNWFLIVENNEGERFESMIPHWNAGLSMNEIKEMRLELSWANRYKLTINSLQWPGIIWNAYFISDHLHVFDKERDTLVSRINKEGKPLPEEMLKKLKPLKLKKDVLKEMKYIDLSDYDRKQMHEAIINEEPNFLLYFNNTNLSWISVLTVGPVLFEGDCFSQTVASSQWVFFNDSFTYKNEVYANQIFLNKNVGELKTTNTSPIILKDEQ